MIMMIYLYIIIYIMQTINDIHIIYDNIYKYIYYILCGKKFTFN